MLDPKAAHQMAKDACFLLTASDPVLALKTVGRALKMQTRGAQRSAIRILVETLAEREPGIAGDLLADLTQLATNPKPLTTASEG
jgi:hypothetical protein